MLPIQLGRNAEPLLNQVNGKPRGKVARPVEEPEDVTALPMDSDENNTDEPDFGDPHYDSSDDEPARGDIRRSDFKPVTASQKSGIATGRAETTLTAEDYGTPERRSARPGRKRAVGATKDSDSDELGVPSPKKKAKTGNQKPRPPLGSHIGDGFLVDRKPKPVKSGYGKKTARATKPSNVSPGTSPRRVFERVKSMSESVSPQQARKFHMLLPGSEASSPFKSPRASNAAKVAMEEDSSSLSELESDDVLSDPPRPDSGRGNDQKPGKQQHKKTKRPLKKSTTGKLRQLSADEDMSQRPVFKMPEGYNDFVLTAELAGIDMPLYTDSTVDKKADIAPDKAPCPMCDEPVDKQWLSDYSKGQRMTIARQAKFCHQHKKRSAKELWETKGYPEVDWGQLETRIGRHRAYLESLINGAESHFGERLREKIWAGKNRTLFKTDDYPVPGYYGLRGMSTMTECIVDAFSSLLRQRAPLDRLISARGHTTYVQSVLVPELGVRLIKEDMGIAGDEEARTVMFESRAVGVILNDETGEPRAGPLAVAEAQDVDDGGGDDSHGDDASGTHDGASGTGGGSDGGHDGGELTPRIQRVVDSDSDVPSLESLRGYGSRAPGKGCVNNGGSKLGMPPVLDKDPVAPARGAVDDSDSDLLSLASLDKP